jgi:hypothetical protein
VVGLFGGEADLTRLALVWQAEGAKVGHGSHANVAQACGGRKAVPRSGDGGCAHPPQKQ